MFCLYCVKIYCINKMLEIVLVLRYIFFYKFIYIYVFESEMFKKIVLIMF